MIRKINESVSRKQKELFVKSELSYYTNSESLLEEKIYEEFGLRLLVRRSNENSKMTVYYIVNERESMLYDFAYKKRRRLIGEEQLVVDYIEALLGNIESESESGKAGVKI